MLATVQYHPSDERVNWRISIILRVGLVFNESALCEPQSAGAAKTWCFDKLTCFTYYQDYLFYSRKNLQMYK